MTFAFVDINKFMFKFINDNYGHFKEIKVYEAKNSVKIEFVFELLL